MRPAGFEPAAYGLGNRGDSRRKSIIPNGVKDFSTNAFPFPCPTDPADTPSDLAAVVEAWPNLPEALRAGIVAMVKASGG